MPSRHRALSIFAHWRPRLLFWTGAVAAGAFAAAFAILSSDASNAFRRLLAHHPTAPLWLTPLGFALIAILTRHVFPGAEGSGVPQTIAMLSDDDPPRRARVLSLRTAAGRVLLTVLGFASGAAIGREGPTVHLGAALVYNLGHRLHAAQRLEHGLILAGSAAGLAAAFNTPLAGIVFAIEGLGRGFEERVSGTVLITVTLAGATAIAILGNYSYFGFTTSHLSLGAGMLGIVTCGLAGGVLGALYSHLLVWGSRHFASHRRRSPALWAGACGLALAVLGLISHGLAFDAGYAHAKDIINGVDAVPASFPFVKLVASLLSFWSGIPGGIFAPALVTGAGLGGTLAHLGIPIAPSALAVLAMAAYFAGVVQMPITAFVIVVETTSDHSLMLPLIATAFVASSVSRLLTPVPVYRALAGDFLAGR